MNDRQNKIILFFLICIVFLVSCGIGNNQNQTRTQDSDITTDSTLMNIMNENDNQLNLPKSDAFKQTIFNDIDKHWAKGDIELLAYANLVSGTSTTTFSPDENITRAEFSALLTRGLQLYTRKPNPLPFKDIPSNAWYLNDVKLAYDNGVVGGYPDQTFKPDKEITRQELAAMSLRAYEYLEGKKEADLSTLSQFGDKQSIQNWAKSAVAITSKLGFVKGYDGKFHPNKLASRAEAAVILKRILFATEKKEKVLLSAKGFKLAKYAQVSCVPKDDIHVILSSPMPLDKMDVNLVNAYSPTRNVSLKVKYVGLPKPAGWDGMTHEFMLSDATVPGETIEATYNVSLPYGNKKFTGTCIVPHDPYAAIESINVLNDNQLVINLSNNIDKENALNKEHYTIYNEKGSIPVSNVTTDYPTITITLGQPLKSDSLFYVQVANLKTPQNELYSTYEKIILHP